MAELTIDLDNKEWLLFVSDFQLIGLEEVLSDAHFVTLVIVKESCERVLLEVNVVNDVGLFVAPVSND